MLMTAKSDAHKENTAYAVYTYQKENTKNNFGTSTYSNWSRACIAPDKQDAFHHAESLFASGKYLKIEVKKMSGNRNQGKVKAVTVKTFSCLQNENTTHLAAVIGSALMLVFTVCAYITL